ncbi:NNP family nitrate/nitrite transporter-like MFS transporter [Paenibacillus phyllosphaerae]|uniref:NNP family nitrate/nitrite transporter-like MFS transporter n=1 Tax=Paenibacillus phyllosphaerae TaxID=274593 RepID=A0A7W5B190_9BACL|nr:MFS transporter [Paenibacillus phyllosphaerae]MBB3112269.1 NNP family nitrate/nitrite transporter-like MFS transporter [Paenibacillus phyllosphaerae]
MSHTTNRPIRALLLSTLAMAASFIIWNMLSPLAGQIKELYQLTGFQASALVAAPVLLGSVMRIPMGIYTDRFGGRRVFALTMLFLVVPLVAASFATSYMGLLLCALFIGMGGSTFAISLTYVSRWFPPQKQGFVLGLAGLGNLGVAAASYGVPVLHAQAGLPGTFRLLAIMIGVMAIGFWFLAKDLPRPSTVKTFKQSMSVLRVRSTWLLSMYYSLTFGGFVAFSVYLPTLLKEQFALSATEAGLRTAVFVLLATLIRPLGGLWADRIGSRRVLAVVFVGIAISALLMAFSLEQIPLLTAGCLMGAAFLGIGNGAVFKMVPEVSPQDTGAVTGIVGAAGGLGGFFPPLLLGFIHDASGSYVLGFILLTAFAVVCFGFNQWTKRPGIEKRAAHAV